MVLSIHEYFRKTNFNNHFLVNTIKHIMVTRQAMIKWPLKLLMKKKKLDNSQRIIYEW